MHLLLLAAAGAGAGCAAGAAHRTAPASTRTTAAKQVTILYVADLHAQLEPHPEFFWHGEERIEEAGGFARVAAAIAQIRQERGGEVLVLDAGDTLQGSGVAALTEGRALVPVLDEMGFDAAIPGNWEVVYGKAALKARASELRHPFIAANIRDEETGERVFAPYFIKEVAGIRVAVVGFSDPDVPVRQPPAYSAGLQYDGAGELADLVRHVREQERADVVLLASHIGLARAVALTQKLPGIDAHLSADTHERTYEPIERGGVWTVEPGAFGSFLGRLDLWVRDGEIVDRRWELIELTASRFPEDPEIAARVAEATRGTREELGRTVGTVGETVMRYSVVESSLDKIIADALREAGGTQIGLSNGFRFGTPILPGPITEADLWNILPISTPLKTGVVTGRQLRDFWEQELENVFAKDPERLFGGWLPRPSGMTLRFRKDAPKGSRVIAIDVGGEPLRDDALYTVTACEREGDTPDKLCRIPGVRDTKVLDLDAHEAVRRHLAKHPDIRAPDEVRVVATDVPGVLRTQAPR